MRIVFRATEGGFDDARLQVLGISTREDREVAYPASRSALTGPLT